MEIRCKDCNALLCSVPEDEIKLDEWYIEHRTHKDKYKSYYVNTLLVSGHVCCKNVKVKQ